MENLEKKAQKKIKTLETQFHEEDLYDYDTIFDSEVHTNTSQRKEEVIDTFKQDISQLEVLNKYIIEENEIIVYQST